MPVDLVVKKLLALVEKIEKAQGKNQNQSQDENQSQGKNQS